MPVEIDPRWQRMEPCVLHVLDKRYFFYYEKNVQRQVPVMPTYLKLHGHFFYTQINSENYNK